MGVRRGEGQGGLPAGYLELDWTSVEVSVETREVVEGAGLDLGVLGMKTLQLRREVWAGPAS